MNEVFVWIRHLSIPGNWIVNIKSFLYLYYTEACNEFSGPMFASLRLRAAQLRPFEEMFQRWRAVGNTESDLNVPRFEPQTSRSRYERVTARPIGR